MRQHVILRAERFADTVDEAGYLEVFGTTFRVPRDRAQTAHKVAGSSRHTTTVSRVPHTPVMH